MSNNLFWVVFDPYNYQVVSYPTEPPNAVSCGLETYEIARNLADELDYDRSQQEEATVSENF